MMMNDDAHIPACHAATIFTTYSRSYSAIWKFSFTVRQIIIFDDFEDHFVENDPFVSE